MVKNCTILIINIEIQKYLFFLFWYIFKIWFWAFIFLPKYNAKILKLLGMFNSIMVFVTFYVIFLEIIWDSIFLYNIFDNFFSCSKIYLSCYLGSIFRIIPSEFYFTFNYINAYQSLIFTNIFEWNFLIFPRVCWIYVQNYCFLLNLNLKARIPCQVRWPRQNLSIQTWIYFGVQLGQSKKRENDFRFGGQKIWIGCS